MARRTANYIFEPAGKKPRRKKHKGMGLLVLFVAAALITSAMFVNHAGNSQIQLETEYVRVMALDKDWEGLRILHISDLQGSALGSDAEKWNRLLSGAKWNAVVMTGDMVGPAGNSEPMLSLIHILQNLKPDVPVYFIAGDGDPNPVLANARGTPEVLADWVLEAKAAGAVYLDAPAAFEFGKHKVWISPAYLYDMDVSNSAASLRSQIAKLQDQGAQYEMEGGASYRALVYRLDTMDRTLAAIKEMSTADIQIAVNHVPLEAGYIRNAISYANAKQVFNFRAVDLVMCGHMCGGDYRLPGSTAVYINGKGFFPSDEGILGMSRMNSMNMYVSPGIASSSTAPVKVRLFNKPAVTILRFTGNIE